MPIILYSFVLGHGMSFDRLPQFPLAEAPLGAFPAPLPGLFIRLSTPCFAQFFARAPGVGFFNCRAVARQLTPVYRSLSLILRG